MQALEKIFAKMDFDFFGSGEHVINLETAVPLIAQPEKAVFLDLRTKEEAKWLSFNFALHIPVNELPQRIAEVPKDKLIILFCSSVVRAAMVYPYFLALGFERVKILSVPAEGLVGVFKPGPLYKRRQKQEA